MTVEVFYLMYGLCSGFNRCFSEEFLHKILCFLSVKGGFLTLFSLNYREWKTRLLPQVYTKTLEQDRTRLHVSTCITIIFLFYIS